MKPWIWPALFAALLVPVPASHAATPAGGALSLATPSVTWTGNVSGANVDETTCQDGTTCDVYTLTLNPGDYTGKRIAVGISWLVPANDYDMYVHAGTAAGPIVTQSADGAPQTAEQGTISIDPPVVTTARVYVVHVVCFTVTPLTPYDGAASLVATPPPRTPVYLAGNLHFSPNVTLLAPVTTTDGEPSCRVDVKGNCYVGGIRGVPAGVDLWRFDLDPASPTFDPGLGNPAYLGQPDAFLPQDPEDPTTGGADGGGDIDIAVNFPAAPSDTPIVTIVSLAAADISSALSTDRGATFTLSPLTAIAPSDDRQWIEADGPNTIYMMYRAPVPATGLFVQRSDDHGLTYPVTGVVNPSGTTPGYIDVDHATGTVYVAHTSSSALTVANSTDGGLTWRNNTVDNTTSHGNLFDVVKVGDDGTVYAVWSDLSNIYMAHSTDGGVTWSDKVRVNDNTAFKVNLLPWIEAGSAGRVAIVWYGTTNPVDDDDADWQVLFTQTTNATDPNPTFRQQVISDHVIHGANVSLGGLQVTGGDNRNLLDYFQIALDPQGAAVIAYTDDHNDFDGNLYVTRQLDGTSLYANANGTGQVNPVAVPPPPPPSPFAPEVSDFLHDAVTGLLLPIAADNPYDILWVDYACEPSAQGEDVLVATMKVSDLATVPPATTWRVHFAANAAGGVSDRGDQFYMQANSQNPAAPAFTFGTAVRNGDGSLSYTSRGTCQGMLDTGSDLVVLKMPLNDLNSFVTHGPPVTVNSVLYGLRGSCFTAGANVIRDNTRGGTSFRFPACGPTPAELETFAATAADGGVLVTWQFTADVSFSDVRVERSDLEAGPWAPLSAAIRTDARGRSEVLDPEPGSGVHWYRLSAVSRTGDVRTFGPLSVSVGARPTGPTAEFLGGPRPNPTLDASSIQFRVGQPGFVELGVFDVKGARVRTIASGVLDAGTYEKTWDGRTDRFSNAPGGIYFFVLNTSDGVTSRRVVLTR